MGECVVEDVCVGRRPEEVRCRVCVCVRESEQRSSKGIPNLSPSTLIHNRRAHEVCVLPSLPRTPSPSTKRATLTLTPSSSFVAFAFFALL
jgi:hypothetical protein